MSGGVAPPFRPRLPVLHRCAMHRFANPARFLRIARIATPIVFALGMILTGAGLWIGLFA